MAGKYEKDSSRDKDDTSEWYCRPCQKQCRNEKAYECHIISEHHQLMSSAQKEIGSNDFAEEFAERHFYTKQVNATTMNQDYIANRDHLHMNSAAFAAQNTKDRNAKRDKDEQERLEHSQKIKRVKQEPTSTVERKSFPESRPESNEKTVVTNYMKPTTAPSVRESEEHPFETKTQVGQEIPESSDEFSKIQNIAKSKKKQLSSDGNMEMKVTKKSASRDHLHMNSAAFAAQNTKDRNAKRDKDEQERLEHSQKIKRVKQEPTSTVERKSFPESRPESNERTVVTNYMKPTTGIAPSVRESEEHPFETKTQVGQEIPESSEEFSKIQNIAKSKKKQLSSDGNMEMKVTKKSANRQNKGTKPFKISRGQLEALAEFLEENPGIVSGTADQSDTKRRWEAVASNLNTLGNAVKPYQGWSKNWSDRKYRLNKILKDSDWKSAGDPLPMLSDIDTLFMKILITNYQQTAGNVQVENSLSMNNFATAAIELSSSEGEDTDRVTPSPVQNLNVNTSHSEFERSQQDEEAELHATEIKTEVKREGANSPTFSQPLDNTMDVAASVDGLAVALRESGQIIAEALNNIASALSRN